MVLFYQTFLKADSFSPIKEVRINDRFFINGDQLRGFKNLGIGPRDESTSDALGGEIYYVVEMKFHFHWITDDLGVGGIIFGDIGTLYNTASSGVGIKDQTNLRASVGVGLSWISPFGPVNFI